MIGRAARSTKQVWKGYHVMRTRRGRQRIALSLCYKICMVIKRSLTAGRQVAIIDLADHLDSIKAIS